MDINSSVPHKYESEITSRNIAGNVSSVAVKKKSALLKEVNESIIKIYLKK